MTELQIAIRNIELTLFQGEKELAKLKIALRDLGKPKVPSFPLLFFAVPDSIIRNTFIIGLRTDNIQGDIQYWEELPNDFKGRGLFSRKEIRQIIKGLQTLLGDSQ